MNSQKALVIIVLSAVSCAAAAQRIPAGCDPSVMSEKYWRLWTDDVQARIDADIERNRKADGCFALPGVPTGTEVRVEQVSHAFLFGAHSFKVNRTGRHDVNEKYVRVFGELFNAATVPVHWNRIEPQPGCVRWKTEWTDTEEFFNTHDMATCMRYSPCAPLEQTIDFFRSRGVRMVAHPLVWGSVAWVWPHWVYNQYCPPQEKRFLDLPLQDVAERTPGELFCPHDWLKRYRARWAEIMREYTAEDVGRACPVFCRNLKMLQDRRIRGLAERIGDRIDEWVVVNESSDDWHGDGETGEPVCMSAEYGPMPGDYVFRAFKTAGEAFPKGVKFILNDYRMNEKFIRQIRTMKEKGLRLDKIGAQMHIFSDTDMRRLVAGEPIGNKVTPADIWAYFGQLSALEVPLFLSEITIPSLGNSKTGQQQQAIAAYHLYRIWFSLPAMTGITWWHTLDLGSNGGGCESAQSGIFTAEGDRKPAYFALDQLINREWRTRCEVKVRDGGTVRFRGFCGDYRLSWKDAAGREHAKIVRLEFSSNTNQGKEV